MGGGGGLGASPGRQLLRGVVRYSFKERSDRVRIFWRLNLYAVHTVYFRHCFYSPTKKINLKYLQSH